MKTGSRMKTTDEMTFQYLKFYMTGQEKGDLLIQVTTWAGSAVVDPINSLWFDTNNLFSLHANPLARSPGQVKLDSDKWKLWENLFE